MIKAKGRLFPFGFLLILKDIRKNDTADLLLQAVNDEYKYKGVTAVFFAQMLQAFIDIVVWIAISSPALETNNRAFLTFTNEYEVLIAANRTCDSSLAVHDINFTTEYDFTSGISETIKWYEKNKWI